MSLTLAFSTLSSPPHTLHREDFDSLLVAAMLKAPIRLPKAKRAGVELSPQSSSRSKRQRKLPQRFNDGHGPLSSSEERALRQAISNSQLLQKREFVDVKLAPILYPTEEEFAHPLKYISKLRSIGNETGIVKIVPPKGWNPPPCTEQCFQGEMYRPFPTKKQSVHRLQEGASYSDGRNYYIDKFRSMADEFREQFLKNLSEKKTHSSTSVVKDVATPGNDAENKDESVSSVSDHSMTDIKLASEASSVKSEQDVVKLEQDVVKSEQDVVKSEQYIAAKSEQDVAKSEQDVAKLEQDVAKSEQDVAKSEQDVAKSEQHAVNSEAVQSLSLLEFEKEYWRIVETNSQEVDVEYGSDLDTLMFGSGFPKSKETAQRPHTSQDHGDGEGNSSVSSTRPETSQRANTTNGYVPCDFSNPDYYAKTGWNLNNLPHHPGSVLRHIQGNYNGINVPWMYVGMLFGTFAWHNEDNYLYSISYNHTGATKVWYGVPGSQASKLEECMRAFLMDRFREVPDLIYHLVTMIGPSILLNKGIDVCKAYQEPGHFIVTFPQAFHGGFSTGFNIGEAVNFALPDWLVHGRLCAERYRAWGRSSPISRERLVMAMARNHSDLDHEGRVSLACELEKLLREQDRLRREVYKAGVLHACRMPNENPDDEEFDEKRLCSICQHLCYFACVVCSCDSDRVVCLRHHKNLCNCNRRENCFLFWSTVKEIQTTKTNLEKLIVTGSHQNSE